MDEMLAEKVMGWRLGPGRFLIDGRRWLPQWRFQPTKNIADAFQLLQRADVVEYALSANRNEPCWAQVRTMKGTAKASASSLPLAICVAIARVYGIRPAVLE
jgi:hypothetical protein